ncbi:Nif3-like dinuclear metal center hexameric protein [Herbiconiux flava]|uniref:GTP cyclohydrolase 1 type 2 homolog n=1 Tax=Herbiconiux flava TaxID=881268 RepID=A0A852SRZ7_9MICO|nr:Nif3-like dinuclear metal center hexameric protein [Herbiconiux flava]NYD71552.1 dinuclear metal center YbgI/SA1388 family protein [Herbiconiux flava]GLK18483.1 GTP cyclohydrolase 1 type 2 [Herbiconiux flava]
MPTSLADLNAAVERLWPTEFAEGWDAPGLVSGAPGDEVRRVLLAVDAVSVTVDEAVDTNADVLLVHHPLLLRGVTTVAETGYKGALLARLIRARCGLIAAHTNADIVDDGTSAVIAAKLGLVETRPIVAGAREGTGLGRVGRMPEPTTLGRLALALGDVLPATATGVRVAGDYDQPVSTVALCGGAGDSLLGDPAVRAADVYITSDLRHHPASESREQTLVAGGPALIDVSHWASEWLWLETAAAQLAEALPDVEFAVSELRTDPWDFVVTQ